MDDAQATSLVEGVLGMLIDRVTDRLVAEGFFGFSGPSAIKAVKFRLESERQRRWLAPHACLFPGCASQTIPRSHTVSRSGPLALISEEGHVLAPRVDPKTGKLAMSRIGVRNASTFPGFCTTHELLFAHFERDGILATGEHQCLQFFRIACREVRIKEDLREHLAKVLAEHEAVLTKRCGELFQEEVGRIGGRFSGTVTRFEGSMFSQRLEPLRDAVRRLGTEIEHARTAFLDPLLLWLGRPTEDIPLAVKMFSVEESTPVTLAGQGNFVCAVTGQDHDVRTLLSVWPEESTTKLALMAPAAHSVDLDHYFEQFTTSGLTILSMIETWMVHGSDHWFIKPSVWDSIPLDRRERILVDSWDLSRNIGMEYERSIFDQLRKQAIDAAPAELRQSAPQFLERHRQKLTLEGCALPPGHPGAEGRTR